MPDYKDWATNSDIRERLGWEKETLKSVVIGLDREGSIVYRDGCDGALALKTPEIAA